MLFPRLYAGECNDVEDVVSKKDGQCCHVQAHLPAFGFEGIAGTSAQPIIQGMREKSLHPDFASLLDQFRLDMEVRRTIIARQQEQVDMARALISESRRAIGRSRARIPKQEPMHTASDRQNSGF